MNTLQEVKSLLNQIRFLASNPKIEKCSDQIEVLCRAYMEPVKGIHGMSLGLRASQATMFDLLLSKIGEPVTREALADVSRGPAGRDPSIESVDVNICRMRKKLRGTGYRIETVWGTGHRMVQDN